MWKCICRTENRAARKRCSFCKKPKDRSLVPGCIALLIAFWLYTVTMYYEEEAVWGVFYFILFAILAVFAEDDF